jgi:transposase
MAESPTRFIGLDVHKEYFVAIGANQQREIVFGPRRLSVYQLENWILQHLTGEDAVVLEMTTNTYLFYDALLPHIHSVFVVHPPHVALVTKVSVKTDKKAALALAQLHATGLLEGIWILHHAVRDLRALLAQREKMVRLSTMAKNRLHSLLHRNHLVSPSKPFSPERREWWNNLALYETEQIMVSSDLDTLEFAQKQIEKIEECLKQESAQDPRIPLLIQLPGVAMLIAITILAAIGEIERFPNAKQLVGYAGLGTRVHDSGTTHATGRITTRHGECCQPCRTPSCSLEKRVATVGTPSGPLESRCGNCSQAASRRLACASRRSSRSFCRSANCSRFFS